MTVTRPQMLTGLVSAAMLLFLNCSAMALTKGAWPRLALACENGRTYPIRPVAVSGLGDLVTGYIVLGRGHGIHIRLVPMGDGYRYAGSGIWFDGLNNEAVIYWGTPAAVPCTLVQD